METWKDINGTYGRYSVSSLGFVKNNKTGKLLAPQKPKLKNSFVLRVKLLYKDVIVVKDTQQKPKDPICGVCGRVFVKKNNKQLYCSEDCSKYAHKVKTRELQKNSLEGCYKTVNVAALVAEHFMDFDTKFQKIKFKDGDETNCSVDNLDVSRYLNQEELIENLRNNNDPLSKGILQFFLCGDTVELGNSLTVILPDIRRVVYYQVAKLTNYAAKVDFHLVEDIVQESLLKMFISLKEAKLKNVSNMTGWIITVAKTVTVNYFKNYGWNKTIPISECDSEDGEKNFILDSMVYCQ